MQLRNVARYSLLGILAILAAWIVYFRCFQDRSESARLTRSLIASLHSKDPLERQDAAVELAAMRLRREGGTEALPALIERLDDDDSQVRQQAAESLLSFGEDAARALPKLARITREGPADLRIRVIDLLGAIHSDEADQALLRTLADPDPAIRLKTVSILGARGHAAAQHVPRLIELLKSDPEVQVRQAALTWLVEMDRRSKLVEKAKLLALRDKNATVRRTAIYVMRMSIDAMPFLGAFRNALRDPDPGVRGEAIEGLGRIGLHHHLATEALCMELANPETHDAAQKAIAHVFYWPVRSGDPFLEAAVVPLIELIRQSDPRTAGIVAALLCETIARFDNILSEVPESLCACVPVITARLRKREPLFHRYVLLSLLGEFPNVVCLPLVDVLTDSLRESSTGENGEEENKLWKSVVAAVALKIRLHDPLIRCTYLGGFLPRELLGDLVPHVCQALEDEDENLRAEAVAVLMSNDLSLLATSDAARRRIVACLCQVLKDRSPDMYGWVTATFEESGTEGTNSKAILSKAMSAIEAWPTAAWKLEQAVRQPSQNSSKADRSN